MKNAVAEIFRAAFFLTRLLTCLSVAFYVHAESRSEEQTLPDPLTLEHALSFASADHPDLEQAFADLDLARAREQGAGSVGGLNISLQARARYIEPSALSVDRSHGDYSASLLVRKRLYDFGRSSNALDAASAEVLAQQWRVVDTRQARRLAIMARFYDVLLADLRYARDYEIMSIGYVRYNAALDRRKLGQVSDIDLAELHTRYQEMRRRWFESTADQRITRGRLARALNWAGRLPVTLVEPETKKITTALPALDALQNQALQTNPIILSLRERANAMAERVLSAGAGYWPTLDAELEASEYSRDLSSRDPWRASLILDIPLYSGGRVSADLAQQRAEVRHMQATLAARRQEVKFSVQELYNQLGVLGIQREEVKVLSDYRELYLDRSRMLYEQEMRTDLGDAMIRQTEARLRSAETEFAIVMTRERLAALLGVPLESLNAGEKK